MIHMLYWKSDGTITTDFSVEVLEIALRDEHGVLWIDLVEEPVENCSHILLNTFGFHPLAVADALEESHVPKVDDWEQYVNLILHGVKLSETQLGSTEFKISVDTLELDCFLGLNYLVTFQVHAIEAVKHLRDQVRSEVRSEAQLVKHGSTYLLYSLADAMVADYLQALDTIDEQIDWVEDHVFLKPTPDLPEKIFALRRALLRLRRILAPQREVLSKLARGDYNVIAESERIYFRDVYDHLVRMHDITEGMRDLVGSALDTYLSVINNRMNDTMKTLTIITSLFMPVSFLAGFFGMNFFQPSQLNATWTNGVVFSATLAVMIASPLLLYLWMRKRASL